MSLRLRNSTSQAHLEDLRTRLSIQMACGLFGAREETSHPVVVKLIEVVRAMDRGAIPLSEALRSIDWQCVPGFDFHRWLLEMVDEGVYFEPCGSDPG